MVTLKQIEKENKRLREMQSKLKKIQKDNEDRRNLLKENKKLQREIKFGKSLSAGRTATKIAKNVGKRTGKQVGRIGIGAFKGLQRYGKFLEEQERKQRSVNRKLKSVKKKTKRR